MDLKPNWKPNCFLLRDLKPKWDVGKLPGKVPVKKRKRLRAE